MEEKVRAKHDIKITDCRENGDVFYAELLAGGQVDTPSDLSTYQSKPKVYLEILRVSRQVYEEARPSLYKYYQFTISIQDGGLKTDKNHVAAVYRALPSMKNEKLNSIVIDDLQVNIQLADRIPLFEPFHAPLVPDLDSHSRAVPLPSLTFGSIYSGPEA